MKILHTSDLHLGAKTENKSRLPEQKDILFEIVDICKEQKIDVVVIAGDIFHTSTPAAEAEDLFYDFLERLTKDNDRVALVVAGNHDDPNRLSACLPLAKRHNIVICSDLAPLPTYEADRSPAITKTGRGFVKIEKNGEKICAALLPYSTHARLDDSLKGEDLDCGETYEQNIAAWSKFVCQEFETDAFNLLVTHQYLVGAEEERNGKRVRVSIGDSLAVSAKVLPECDYIAVGHLHSTQKVPGGKNVYYSGAPIKLRLFDDSPKVLVTDTQTKKTCEVALKNPANIVLVQAKNAEDAKRQLEKQNSKDLVYLKFVGISALDISAIKELYGTNSNIVSIRFEHNFEKEKTTFSAKNLSPKDLFVEFVKNKRGEAPSDELVQIFLELLEGKDETDLA